MTIYLSGFICKFYHARSCLLGGLGSRYMKQTLVTGVEIEVGTHLDIIYVLSLYLYSITTSPRPDTVPPV